MNPEDIPEMKIIIEVSNQAENFYGDAVKLGDHAGYAFRESRGSSTKNRHRAQMTGLENVAESTLKISDVLDYIKKQTARSEQWRKKLLDNNDPNRPQSERQPFGERLRRYLEVDLAARRDGICSDKRLNVGNKTDAERQLRRRIHLLLIRQFIRQMVVQYEYRITLGEEGTSNGASG